MELGLGSRQLKGDGDPRKRIMYLRLGPPWGWRRLVGCQGQVFRRKPLSSIKRFTSTQVRRLGALLPGRHLLPTWPNEPWAS